MSMNEQVRDELTHDARQSIATILTLVAAGRQEIGDTEMVLRRLDQVAGQAKSLAAMLDQTHDHHHGRRHTPAPTVGVSAETTAAVEALAPGYTGTLRLVVTTGAWSSMAPAALRRVVTNLVRNAFRAAGPDGVVQVSVARTAGRVVLEVDDDGPGFGRLSVINGIGLRSSSRLVLAAGGHLDAGRGRLGGAAVRVNLPSLTPPAEAHHEDLVV
jgi:signal transduction histidine kinase